MPTHEWTLADDRPGGGPRNFRTALIVVAVLSVVAVLVVLRLLGPGSSEQGVPKIGHKTYEAQVDCRVNSSGDSGTVTIDGTIRGESSRFEVTVEVLDTATKQRLALQTFEVAGTTTFGGTTPAQAPVGSAGIECRITEVR